MKSNTYDYMKNVSEKYWSIYCKGNQIRETIDQIETLITLQEKDGKEDTPFCQYFKEVLGPRPRKKYSLNSMLYMQTCKELRKLAKQLNLKEIEE